jgi:hypothetical protein
VTFTLWHWALANVVGGIAVRLGRVAWHAWRRARVNVQSREQAAKLPFSPEAES